MQKLIIYPKGFGFVFKFHPIICVAIKIPSQL